MWMCFWRRDLVELLESLILVKRWKMSLLVLFNLSGSLSWAANVSNVFQTSDKIFSFAKIVAICTQNFIVVLCEIWEFLSVRSTNIWQFCRDTKRVPLAKSQRITKFIAQICQGNLRALRVLVWRFTESIIKKICRAILPFNLYIMLCSLWISSKGHIPKMAKFNRFLI